jgi:hypothetical protein
MFDIKHHTMQWLRILLADDAPEYYAFSPWVSPTAIDLLALQAKLFI